MSEINDILSSIPLSTLAKQLGVTQTQAKSASTQAIKTLLSGLHSNVSTSDGEASLAAALQQHATTGRAVASGKKIKIDSIDVSDGKKIVTHALGADVNSVASALSNATGTEQSLLSKLLPILAPVVMAYLASKVLGGGSSAGSTKKPKKEQQDTSALGDILGGLGGILGGGTQQQTSDSGLLGGILGGILGGGTSSGKSGSGNVLGDILGNLF
ncbi:MAG: DUF937 domain-containing protein [Propionibacteriaceae bacterium]|jgi:hypothetical protein|nr:DUF937 domain-containing protein [Propionibacteriaceae bacterium]